MGNSRRWRSVVSSDDEEGWHGLHRVKHTELWSSGMLESSATLISLFRYLPMVVVVLSDFLYSE